MKHTTWHRVAPTLSPGPGHRWWCLLAVAALALVASSGCVSKRPAWTRPNVLPDATHAGEDPATHDEARRRSAAARDALSLQQAIDAWESILAVEPRDAEALVRVADHSILLATAFTDTRGAKRLLYRRARLYSELAMYTDAGFAQLAERGAKPWEATAALDDDDMLAMMTWMTAVLYEFKECMSTPVRIANIGWIARMRPFLERMETIDPTWAGGAVPFNRGFYFFVLPRSLGGDKERAAEEFERAVELGPDRMVYRWGRARFFRVRTNDREGFRKDLEWVLARDPEATSDPTVWARYVQADARKLLNDIDRYF